MRKKILELLNQLRSFLQLPMSHPPPVQDEVPTKGKYQHSLIRRTNLKQCYYCGGGGILNYSSKFDGFEFSGRMGMRDIYTSPSSQCPLCKGTGFIEDLDQVENS